MDDLQEKKCRCKLCGALFKDSDMSEEHYPARSTGNDDILDRVVEDGGYLVVDDPEIGLGIRLALVVAIAGQLVLPAPYIRGLYLIERHPAKEGRYLEVDHEPFVGQSRGLEPLLHILKVKPDEVLKHHPKAGIRPAYEVALPLQRLAFGGKSALFLVYDLAGPVLNAHLRHPLACVSVFCY